jgi:hypothetical protein
MCYVTSFVQQISVSEANGPSSRREVPAFDGIHGTVAMMITKNARKH